MSNRVESEYQVLANKFGPQIDRIRKKKGQTGMIVTRNKLSETIISFKRVYFNVADFKSYRENQRRNGLGHK